MKEMEEKINKEQELKEIELKAAHEKLEAERQQQLAELKAQQEQLRVTGNKEMQRKLQEERLAFEQRMKE